MYRIIVMIFAIFLINPYLNAQTGIDYYPKMLQKEFNNPIGEDLKLKEIVLSSDITKQILLGKFYSNFNHPATSIIKYIYVGRVNTCRAGGCSVNRNQVNDKPSEFFDYFILYDSAVTVQQVKIYNYQATHGQEVTAKNWLKQFKNYKGEKELIAGKNVDAISGATISVDAITFDIEHKTALLKQAIH